MIQAGTVGSFIEGSIFDQLFGRPENMSVSAAQVFHQANSDGIPIYRITESNLSAVNSLSVDDAVKEEIIAAAQAGKVAVVSERNVSRGSWSGTGYVVIDPASAAWEKAANCT